MASRGCILQRRSSVYKAKLKKEWIGGCGRFSWRGGRSRVPAVAAGRALLLAILAFSMGALFAPRTVAQDGGPANENTGVARLFGPGNSVHGTVTAVAKGSLTVRTDEDTSYTVFYSANTRIMKDRQPINPGDIHVGDMLVAAGQVDAKAKTLGAVFVVDIDAAEVRKAREDFGKTWTAGKVQAIHDLKIVIERMYDKQTQVVAVDENTSFHMRSESVTLGDIKVGDFIRARGKVENDTFLATTVQVMSPLAGNPGGRPGDPAVSPEPPSGQESPQ